MNSFKDLFSVQAKDYALYRPHYPSELYSYLATLPLGKKLCWDAGTGNGQAAVKLAEIFDHVIATDPSEKQIKEAQLRNNITYKIEAAETPGFTEKVNLITVAQAFHWFKHEKFADACRMVATSDCHLVVWTYAVANITPEIDETVDELYQGILGPYWEKERKLVEDGYKSIILPFNEVATPPIKMTAQWSRDQLLGYLSTWSALQTFLKTNSYETIHRSFEQISAAWGDAPVREITWPLGIRTWKI